MRRMRKKGVSRPKRKHRRLTKHERQMALLRKHNKHEIRKRENRKVNLR